MFLTPHLLFLAQTFSAEDIQREIGRLDRNFAFLSYGLIAAWVILTVYVVSLVARERRIARQLRSLEGMLEIKDKR